MFFQAPSNLCSMYRVEVRVEDNPEDKVEDKEEKAETGKDGRWWTRRRKHLDFPPFTCFPAFLPIFLFSIVLFPKKRKRKSKKMKRADRNCKLFCSLFPTTPLAVVIDSSSSLDKKSSSSLFFPSFCRIEKKIHFGQFISCYIFTVTSFDTP